MKAMKMIMAAAMVMLLAACGGKKFDAEKANKLCDKYEESRFDDKEWEEFADIYEAGINKAIDMADEIVDEIKPGMTWTEVGELSYSTPERKEFTETMDRMQNIAYRGSDDMPDKVSKKIKKIDEKVEKHGEELSKKIKKKMEE